MQELTAALWPGASLLLPLPGLILAILYLLRTPAEIASGGGNPTPQAGRRRLRSPLTDDLWLAAWALATLVGGQGAGACLPAAVAFWPAAMSWIGFIGIIAGIQVFALIQYGRGRSPEGVALLSCLLVVCAPFSHDAGTEVWWVYATVWPACAISMFVRPVRRAGASTWSPATRGSRADLLAVPEGRRG